MYQNDGFINILEWHGSKGELEIIYANYNGGEWNGLVWPGGATQVRRTIKCIKHRLLFTKQIPSYWYKDSHYKPETVVSVGIPIHVDCRKFWLICEWRIWGQGFMMYSFDTGTFTYNFYTSIFVDIIIICPLLWNNIFTPQLRLTPEHLGRKHISTKKPDYLQLNTGMKY